MSQTIDLVITRLSFSIPNRASSSDFHRSQTGKQNSILLHFTAFQMARRNFTAKASFLPSAALASCLTFAFFVQISSVGGSLLEKGLLCGGGSSLFPLQVQELPFLREVLAIANPSNAKGPFKGASTWNFPLAWLYLTLVLKEQQIWGEILFVKRQNRRGHQEPLPWRMRCKQ